MLEQSHDAPDKARVQIFVDLNDVCESPCSELSHSYGVGGRNLLIFSASLMYLYSFPEMVNTIDIINYFFN